MAKQSSFVVADSAYGESGSPRDEARKSGTSAAGKSGKAPSGGGDASGAVDAGFSAVGSFVPWAEIVKQIVGHVVRGGAASLDYSKQRKRTQRAWQQAEMSNILGIIDMQLENERQEIRRESMMEALKTIDDGFGTGTSEKAVMNRKAIRSVINQIERADSERSAAMLEEEGASTARNQRQSMARRGGGGSIEDAATRRATEETGNQVKKGMTQQRAGLRNQARQPVAGMRSDFTISKGVMNQMRIAEAADETPDMILKGAWDKGAAAGAGDLAEIFTGYRAEAADEKTRKEKWEKEQREKEKRELLRAIEEGSIV